MVNAAGPLRLMRSDDPSHAGQQLVVSLGRFLAPPVAVRQSAQLHAQDSRLDRVQPAVVSLDVMVILLRLPMVAQHANFPRNLGVIGGYRAGLAARSQILAGI